MKNELEKKYELKTNVIGTGVGAAREGRVLNRIIRFTTEGIEYEADQRHAELIVQEMQVQDEKPYMVPYEKESTVTVSSVNTAPVPEDDGPLEEEVGKDRHATYRAVTARANYLALDRADIQYAVKELCRAMSRPLEKDWVCLLYTSDAADE